LGQWQSNNIAYKPKPRHPGLSIGMMGLWLGSLNIHINTYQTGLLLSDPEKLGTDLQFADSILLQPLLEHCTVVRFAIRFRLVVLHGSYALFR